MEEQAGTNCFPALFFRAPGKQADGEKGGQRDLFPHGLTFSGDNYSGMRIDTTACAAMPSPRPVKPNFSVVVALTEMRPASTPISCARRAIMAGGVRRDLGPLADQRDIGVCQPPAPFGDASRRMHQEPGAVGVLPGRFGRRKMPPDVALGQGAIDRVAQGVDADIGIGMAGEALVVRNLYAAQEQRAPSLEHVNVKAGPDPRDHGRRR